MIGNTRRNYLLSFAMLLCSLLFSAYSVTLFAQSVEPAEPVADTLVVCPESLQGELQRWVDYRTSQGHQIKVVLPVASAFGMKQLVREHQANHALRHLVLVGSARGAQPLVPVDLRLAQVNFFFGSELDIATDNSYVDTDQDGDPDLAMGRIPVSTPEELRAYIDRVIRYENDAPQTTWRRRINIIAGVGGFGGVADKTIENTVKILLGDHIPPGYDVTMTYGSWTSPWCPDPRQFSRVALERFNEGCLFWVYVGHGSRHRLDLIRTPLGRFPVMDVASISQINSRQGSPLALFLACHTGAFDDAKRSLAETLLLQNNGPIGVISGTRVTMPTAMGLLALGLMDQQFAGNAETVGEMLRRAKLQMLSPSGSRELAEVREMIVGLNFLLSPRPDLLTQELNEHLHLFHLLGDPLVRVQRPRDLALQLDAPLPAADGTLVLKGDAPFAGQLTLEICYPRDRLRQRPILRDKSKLNSDGLLTFQAEYEKAIDQVCQQLRVDVNSGEFRQAIKLPLGVEGPMVIRAFLESPQNCAIGGIRTELNLLDVIPAAQPESQSERLSRKPEVGRSK